MKSKIQESLLKTIVTISKSKLILAILMGAAMGFNSIAQDKSARGKHESILNYKTELALNDAQVEQIKTVQKEFLPKMKGARKTQDRETMKKLNDERKTKIEQILNPEQLEKWKGIIEKKKFERQDPELKKELRNYKKQNIQPVILEKRKAFETELSSEEKLIIAELRAKREAFIKSAKGQNKEERKQRGKELKMEAHKTLKPIVEKHKPALKKIKSELEPLKTKWKSDMDAIKSKHVSDYRPRVKRKGKSKDEIGVRFLLMDTEK